MKYEIVPTIIAKDQVDLNSKCDRLIPYFQTFHLDIMDGIFVPNHSLDFEEFIVPAGKNYEAHLMVDKPERWMKKKIHNLDIVIANIEKVKDIRQLVSDLTTKKKKIGFALNPETDISPLFPYLKQIDLVLLLAVTPGGYGGNFQSSVYDKIGALRMIYAGDIEVDGGMNPMTIHFCKDVGANRFAVGSYLQKRNDIDKAAEELIAVLRK